jgi:hypothetical protein
MIPAALAFLLALAFTLRMVGKAPLMPDDYDT